MWNMELKLSKHMYHADAAALHSPLSSGYTKSLVKHLQSVL